MPYTVGTAAAGMLEEFPITERDRNIGAKVVPTFPRNTSGAIVSPCVVRFATGLREVSEE